MKHHMPSPEMWPWPGKLHFDDVSTFSKPRSRRDRVHEFYEWKIINEIGP